MHRRKMPVCAEVARPKVEEEAVTERGKAEVKALRIDLFVKPKQERANAKTEYCFYQKNVNILRMHKGYCYQEEYGLLSLSGM